MFSGQGRRCALFRKLDSSGRQAVRQCEMKRRHLVGLQQPCADDAWDLRLYRPGEFLGVMMRACMVKQRMPDAAEGKQQNRPEQGAERCCQTFLLHGIIK